MDDTTSAPHDRLGLEVLNPDQCWELLATTPVGRVAFVDAGEPMVLPVTHAVHGHSIVFRSSAGTKLDAALMAHALAFEVDDWDAEARTGWSVLVRGVGQTVHEDEAIVAFEELELEPWLDAASGGTWVRIRVDEISGRRLGR